MAESRVFTANVVLARHRGGELTQFSIGDEVPEWALELVGEHASQGTTRAANAPVASAPVDTNGADVEGAAEAAAIAAANAAADADGDDEEEDDIDSYEEWTKADLKDEARSREIEGFSSMNKEELIAALEKHDEENE